MAREVARRVLRRVERDGVFASTALSQEMSRSGLTGNDRGLATEIVYGVLRHRSRLDRALVAATTNGTLSASAALRAVLRVGAYQLLRLDRVPDHAAVDDAAGAARRIGGGKMAGFANGLLRRIAERGEPPLPEDPVERVAAEYSLPRWIVDALLIAVGPGELAAAAAGLSTPAPLAIRIDGDRDAVAEQLRSEGEGVAVEVVDRAPRALLVTGLGDPAASPSFCDGLWTVQDVAAQRVVELLAVEPGHRVLDACAGVGGKATYLASLGAQVDAADSSEAKLERLRDTAARLGAGAIETVCVDLTDARASRALADRYDAVLLDAPCTGLGVLRRHPEAKWRVAPAHVHELADLQRRLLDGVASRAASALVYSVCTFTAAEGAGQIAAFCARHPEFRVDAEESTWPHRDGADAFYAARLVRVS